LFSIILTNENSRLDMAITKKAAATKKAAKKTRARTESGAFIADDPATPDVNEAWVGGDVDTSAMSPKQLREHQVAMRSNG